MPLIYAFVARGTTVLADYTSYSGNFATVAIQCLEKCPTDGGNKFTYTCDRHTFNYVVSAGFSKRLFFCKTHPCSCSLVPAQRNNASQSHLSMQMLCTCCQVGLGNWSHTIPWQSKVFTPKSRVRQNSLPSFCLLSISNCQLTWNTPFITRSPVLWQCVTHCIAYSWQILSHSPTLHATCPFIFPSHFQPVHASVNRNSLRLG